MKQYEDVETQAREYMQIATQEKERQEALDRGELVGVHAEMAKPLYQTKAVIDRFKRLKPHQQQ